MAAIKNATIVFTGFTDEALKAKLAAMGANVRQTVSGLTTIVVANDLAKESKVIAFAKAKNLVLYNKADFVHFLGQSDGHHISKPKPTIPPGLQLRANVTLPTCASKFGVYYNNQPMEKIHTVARRIVASMLAKRNGMYVREMSDFLGYSWEDECFLLIVKVSSRTKTFKPEAPAGAYDWLAVEFKWDNKRFSFVGYRSLDEFVPQHTDVDGIELLEDQYQDDLFKIYH
jgi:hypothetical protein